jgi:hypothetical protein
VGGVEGQLDIGGGRARDGAKLLAGDRAWIVEISPVDGRDLLAADEIFIPIADRRVLGHFLQGLHIHDIPPCWREAPFGVVNLKRKLATVPASDMVAALRRRRCFCRVTSNVVYDENCALRPPRRQRYIRTYISRAKAGDFEPTGPVDSPSRPAIVGAIGNRRKP